MFIRITNEIVVNKKLIQVLNIVPWCSTHLNGSGEEYDCWRICICLKDNCQYYYMYKNYFAKTLAEIDLKMLTEKLNKE